MKPRRIGKFEVGELHGAVSQRGKVLTYHARDTETGEECLACDLKSHLLRSSEIRQAIEYGMDRVANLDHPSILRILGRHVDVERGELIYFTDLLPGRPLSKLLRDGAMFTERQVVDIASSLLDALQHAHDRGVCFGNIKSSNVVVRSGQDRAVIVGLPKPPFVFTSIPQLAAYIGYPHECAPEFVLTGEWGIPADIYGVGLVLYEMCVGHLPSKGSSHLADLFAEITDDEFPAASSFLPQISPRLSEVISRAVAKAPEKRFRSAAEMLGQLEKTQPKGVYLISSDRLEELTTRQLPSPIAQTLRSALSQQDEVVQLQRMVDTAQACIQLMASLVVGESVVAKANPAISCLSARQAFSRPSLGHWAGILRDGCKDGSFRTFPEMVHLMADARGRATSCARAIDALVSLRNEVRHGATPSTASARRLLAENRPHLDALLTGALFLRKYRLFVPRRLDYMDGGFTCEVVILRGADAPPQPTTLRLAQPVTTGQVYCADAGMHRLLSLHPLLLWRTCPTCEEEELFFYEAAGDARVHYHSFTKGHLLPTGEDMVRLFEGAGLLGSAEASSAG